MAVQPSSSVCISDSTLASARIVPLQVSVSQPFPHVLVKPGKVLADGAAGVVIERALQLAERRQRFRDGLGTARDVAGSQERRAPISPAPARVRRGYESTPRGPLPVRGFPDRHLSAYRLQFPFAFFFQFGHHAQDLFGWKLVEHFAGFPVHHIHYRPPSRRASPQFQLASPAPATPAGSACGSRPPVPASAPGFPARHRRPLERLRIRDLEALFPLLNRLAALTNHIGGKGVRFERDSHGNREHSSGFGRGLRGRRVARPDPPPTCAPRWRRRWQNSARRPRPCRSPWPGSVLSLEKQTGQAERGGFFVLPPPAALGATAAAPAVAAADCEPLPPSEVDSLVEGAAKRQDLDEAMLRGVIQQESAFRPCAVSPKGAMGLMQLMPASASQLGVPNPFDPAGERRTPAPGCSRSC